MRLQCDALRCLIIAAVVFGACACRGTQRNKWENSNKVFKVRIIEYEIPDFILNSFSHVMESSPVGVDDWSHVLTYNSDDGFKIKDEQIHFVNHKIGYAFMANWYVVTMDGGASWEKRPFTEGWVRDVSMAENGEGKLTIEVYSIEKVKPILLFRTQTFGRHWELTQ